MILLPSDVRIPIFLYLLVTSLNENTTKKWNLPLYSTHLHTQCSISNSKNSLRTAHSIQAKNNRTIMWHDIPKFVPKTGCTLFALYKKKCTYRNASHSTYEGFTKMNQILSLLYTSSYTYRHLYNSTKNPYELADIKRLQLYWKLHNMMITFQVSTTLFCTVFCTAVIWHSCCTKQKKKLREKTCNSK